MSKEIRVLFDADPCSPEDTGRFVEVEDENGKGLSFEWHNDGTYWWLSFPDQTEEISRLKGEVERLKNLHIEFSNLSEAGVKELCALKQRAETAEAQVSDRNAKLDVLITEIVDAARKVGVANDDTLPNGPEVIMHCRNMALFIVDLKADLKAARDLTDKTIFKPYEIKAILGDSSFINVDVVQTAIDYNDTQSCEAEAMGFIEASECHDKRNEYLKFIKKQLEENAEITSLVQEQKEPKP